MEKNVELAYQTLDYIRDHPEEWNQRIYLCGSTACYAGRAVLISLGLSSQSQLWDTRSGWEKYVNLPDSARRALGWTWDESNHVFHCLTNDFAELEQRVKEVLNGDVEASIVG